MLRQDRAVAGLPLPHMLGAEAAGDDAHAIAIEIQRARATRSRRAASSTDAPSWITTPVGPTLTGMRSARSAGATFSGRSRARSSPIRAAGGTPVARDGRTVFASTEPLAQLPLEILAIEKAPLLEERALHPADEILDAALLLRAIGPAHLDAEPEIERHAGKRRIPLRHHAVAAPLQRHRLRPIKHRHQRNAAERREMIDQRAHERLDALDPAPA